MQKVDAVKLDMSLTINKSKNNKLQIYATTEEKDIIDERGISVPVGIGFKFNN